ncbi:MAG: Fic family protein, partial [Lentisphaeria bacterium]|nr:Fic family protein [Lentisphaeria bacterium]
MNKHSEFDEYLSQGEPQRKERAEAWGIAIGLQAVDGLTPSKYLVETAKRHIEGDISIDEVKGLIDSYYRTRTGHNIPDENTEEADRVSANITKLLNERTFSFSPSGYAAIHGRIFDGVFKFAGKFRDCNITKKEWVLRGDTVLYVGFDEIPKALTHDFDREKEFSYRGLAIPEIIFHISRFISDLWQIHAFREGNTRTTAVFAIKYLRSMGFQVGNELFREHSWYFRNALVRANYRNVRKGIEPDPVFLERFFRNLLAGEQNELKNRFMLVNPPDKWAEEPHKHPTSTPQVPRKLDCDSPAIRDLLRIVGEKQCSVKEMMAALNLRDRKNFLDNYLNPAIA